MTSKQEIEPVEYRTYRYSPRTSGVGWYAPAGSLYQAMNSLLVWSFFSEMSPDAPGRTANTGRGRPNSYPELTTSRSPAATGEGTQIDDMPPNSHRSCPSRS